MTRPRRTDSVDAHVARWVTQLPELDPQVEGATTRMQKVVRQLRQDDAAAHVGADVSLEDAETLHALMVQPYPVEATPATLADTCHVTRAAMTSRLDRLVDAGLVTREVDPLDRRRVIVRPTAAGRAAWRVHLQAGIERERRMLEPLSPRELDQLNALLRKVVLAIDDR